MVAELYGAYSEKEAAALKEILKTNLKMYEYTQVAAVANFATICFDIPQQFGRLYPQQIEHALRAISSGVYLAAMPMDGRYFSLENTWARLPQLQPGEELPFFLAPSSYPCKQAFTNEIVRLTGKNYDQNYVLLSQAGIPIPRGQDWCKSGRKIVKATFV